MTQPAFVTRAVRKSFPGGVLALDGFDLSVPAGSFFGLLGRNGAGKTTALRILMGLLRPDSGESRILGADMREASREHRARVAYVAQLPRLYGRLSTAEHSRLLSRFYPRWDAALARELARRFEVDWERKFARLSGGEQRKAAVLLAFAARPAALVLDEPGAGLDPVARRELIDVLVDLLDRREGCSVVLSTHLTHDVERLAEHVGILHAGRMLRAEPLDRLKERIRRVQVVFEGEPPADFAVPGALRTERAGSVVTAIAELESEEPLERMRATCGARVDLFGLELEDIFIELVGPAGGSVTWNPLEGEGVAAQ